MKQMIDFLQTIHPVSPQVIEHLSKCLKHKVIEKKEYILKAGHVARTVYFIEKGLLRAYYMKKDAEVTSWFMREGDVMLSIESFYGQVKSYEYIQALEDCSLFYVDHNEVDDLYRRFPEFNAVGRLLTEKYHVLWVKQLHAIRMQEAKERYESLMKDDPDLLARVPAKYIASYLGVTEVTLSRIKAKIAGKKKK